MWFLVSIPKEETEKADRSRAHSRATLTEDDDRENFCDSKEHLTLKQALEDCLQSYGVRNAIWNATTKDQFYQVSFPYESGKATDCLLQDLTSRGIGSRHDSTIGVFPCPIFFRAVEAESDDDESKVAAEINQESCDEAKKEKEKESGFRSMQKKFLKSVKARLRGDARRKIAFFAEFFSFEILPVKLSLYIQLQLRKRSRQNSNEKLVKNQFYSATVARESASFVANQQLSIVCISRMRRLPPLLFAWRG